MKRAVSSQSAALPMRPSSIQSNPVSMQENADVASSPSRYEIGDVVVEF
jgi:hypothetical protein